VLGEFDVSPVEARKESISVDEIVWRYEMDQFKEEVRAFVRKLLEAKKKKAKSK
jgi:hypothetical protein